MKKSFIITGAAMENGNPAELLDEIREGTGSEEAAASVLRSLQRMGTHPSLEYYEITQVPGRRSHGGPVTNSWRVRADFGQRPDDAGQATDAA